MDTDTDLRRGLPCIQNVLLACRAVGLGASLTTMHLAFHAEIDAYLGLTPERPSCAMLPIGWPVEKFGRPPRRSVDDCLFWERFDASAEGKRSLPDSHG
jgi:nitroreductase